MENAYLSNSIFTRNCGTNVSSYANQRVLSGPLTNKRTGPTLFLVLSRLVLPLQPLFTNDLTSKGVVHLHHLDLDVTPRKPGKKILAIISLVMSSVTWIWTAFFSKSPHVNVCIAR